MEFRHYIDILWRRKWPIIVTAMVTMAVVFLGTHFQTPIYQASTKLRIATSASSELSYSYYINADRLMNTYIDIATSEPVLTGLMTRLKINKLPSIKADIIANTELIKITVEDSSPVLAANAANNLANILITQSSQLYTGGGISSTEVLGKQLAIAKDALDKTQQKYQQLLIQTPAAPEEIAIAQETMNVQQNTYANLLSQYDQAAIRETMQANMITVVEPASVPSFPAKPKKLLNYGLGLFVGILGGAGLALLFENMDTTLHSSDEIETLTELTAVVRIPKGNKKKLDISKIGISNFAEAFRNLATKVQLINHQQPKQVLLVMSVVPREGKSLIVSNLAYALAEAGRKVIAIDCDMRLPKLHELFHLTNHYGLSDFLQRKAGLNKSLQKSHVKDVVVLTSGSPADHPSKLFNSPRMENLIASLSQKFDYVLLDTPALSSFVDTEILAHYANSLVVVVRQAYTKRESVALMGKFLKGFQDKTICLVINQAKDNKDYGYYGYSQKSNKRSNGNNRSPLIGTNIQLGYLKGIRENTLWNRLRELIPRQ
jgi:capsular exopolysaccharide synthesis family protein